ncbi:hypothetical protein SEUBUCD646_0H01460 [Saccharomyces eubayanus]|uniref:Uncharacterized protein n=2 Tax=Saccharomyces TaxID=4930 RepID=A0A6C1EA42_SACPS|nr:hypothetical protein DI49_4935 [Saccharomyces eubayanus]KOG96600.1 hypothetical protein DI49_4935 [Saccharomyces eubayanus]QID85464.1 hypothetical protein GRS66_008042 [Saccharomyces pastorianus]CAI2023237.1 hypothetical protein SEUBUCD650_0H01470 [Saccharomyces eubayanus]CAI2037827.1 hypothetical protein SEUBUCD646_0H01460 [Saccharomyces eubayanus]
MDLNRNWLRWKIAIGGPNGIVLDFPSFLVGCMFTTMIGPLLQKLIGRLLVGLVSVIKFLLIIGSIVFITGVVSNKYTYDDFKISIRKSGEEVTEPIKTAKKKTMPMEKDDTVGSFNYFEIPITKEVPTIPYIDGGTRALKNPPKDPLTTIPYIGSGTKACKNPPKDASRAALSNSNRYENFINMAQHK